MPSKYGSKEEVFAGDKETTRGKLTKKDLQINKKGKVVSIKKAQCCGHLKKYHFKKNKK